MKKSFDQKSVEDGVHLAGAEDRNRQHVGGEPHQADANLK